jgi:hypothetical protein
MTPTGHDPAASSYLPSLDAITAELSVYANRQALLLPPTNPLPDVRVEFAGANLVLKTVSHRAPGQAVKIIAALEGRAPALEILHAKISTIDDTDVNAFTVKVCTLRPASSWLLLDLLFRFLTPQHEQSKGMDQLNTAYV